MFVELFNVSAKGITHEKEKKKKKGFFISCAKIREITSFHVNSVTAICIISLWLLHLCFVLESHFTLFLL